MAVKKEELLKLIDESIVLEERSTPLYARHLRTAMFWSGLPVPVREQIRIQLGVLEQESHKHARLLNDMKKKIEEDERDVF